MNSWHDVHVAPLGLMTSNSHWRPYAGILSQICSLLESRSSGVQDRWAAFFASMLESRSPRVQDRSVAFFTPTTFQLPPGLGKKSRENSSGGSHQGVHYWSCLDSKESRLLYLVKEPMLRQRVCDHDQDQDSSAGTSRRLAIC